jgi:hypothetical protein
MTKTFQPALDQLPVPEGISKGTRRLTLQWVKHTEGFDLFDYHDEQGRKAVIGDDADYLTLFMTLAGAVYNHYRDDFAAFVIAGDMGGQRLFVRWFTAKEKETYRYAYIALGQAAGRLEAGDLNDRFSFFAEITREKTGGESFAKEAAKVGRTLKNENRRQWDRLVELGQDFIKVDLYIFSLLKLYAWGFRPIGADGELVADIGYIRPQPGKPRGASRR